MFTTSVTTSEASSAVRANLCFLLSKAFGSPASFESDYPGMLASVAEDLPEPLRTLAHNVSEEWVQAVEEAEPTLLAYSRLFIGPFDIQAPPYASTYLEPDGRLMGETSRTVAAAYAEAGLVPGEGPIDAPDHIVTEWEFLHYLGYQHAETGDAHWLNVYRQFMDTHFGLWVPRFCEAVASAKESTFYTKLVALAEAFVRDG